MKYKQKLKMDKNEYLCVHKELMNISVLVDDSNLKAATSSNNDRCKTDKLLTDIYKQCRYY